MLKHYVQWVPHHHIGLGNSKLYVLCQQLGHFLGPFQFPTQEGFKHPVVDNRERETRINDRALHCKHGQFSKLPEKGQVEGHPRKGHIILREAWSRSKYQIMQKVNYSTFCAATILPAVNHCQ